MKELIVKYLSTETSGEERQEIKRFFLSHQKELESYFSENGWDEEKYAIIKNDLIPDRFIDDFLSKKESQRSIVKKIIYVSIPVAACLLIFFIVINHSLSPKNTQNELASNKPVIFKNDSNIGKQVRLPDSSLAVLLPGSEIELAANYNQQARNIDLKGEALFYVHKDAQHPFTVFSGNIATTAIGTIFRVINSNTQRITVQLIEGKILVKEKGDDEKSYYLLPGKSITYENQLHRFSTLNNEESIVTGSNSKIKPKELDSITTGDINNDDNALSMTNIVHKNNETVFSDVRLPDVLRELAKEYNIKISYPKAKAAKIRFAGSIGKTQGIQKILSDIAIMNNFHLKKDSMSRSYTFY